MNFWQRQWVKGAAAGIVVALGVLIIALSGMASDTVLQEMIGYLAAIPPFSLSAVRTAPDPVLGAAVIVWWPVVGAVLGWCVGRGNVGKAVAAVAVVALVLGQIQTKSIIERELGAAMEAFGKLLTGEAKLK